MKLPYNTPKRTDPELKYTVILELYRKMRKILNIKFDKNKFIVAEDDSGTFVTIKTQVFGGITDFDIKEILNNTITLYGGSIVIGYTETTCPDTSLTITTPTATIGWQYEYATGIFSITNFGSTFSLDSSFIRRKLYAVKKVGDNVFITRNYKPEVYPSNFGRN